MTKARRGVFTGLGILVALVVLTGCLPASPAWTGSGLRVAVAGDSEIYLLDHAVFTYTGTFTNTVVSAGYQVSTSDEVGAGAADLPKFEPGTTFAGWPSPGPQIDVTVLGVNDMHLTSTGDPSMPYATAEADFDSYLAATEAAGAACHVFVEIPETTPWGLDVSGPTWNAFLATEANSRVAVIVPWASEVAANPDYVGTDGVHQTSAGQAAFTTDILNAMSQCATRVTT